MQEMRGMQGVQGTQVTHICLFASCTCMPPAKPFPPLCHTILTLHGRLISCMNQLKKQPQTGPRLEIRAGAEKPVLRQSGPGTVHPW